MNVDIVENNDFDGMEYLTDGIDGCVLHALSSSRAGHVTQGFPWLMCPCQPEIEMHEEATVVVHRRMQ